MKKLQKLFSFILVLVSSLVFTGCGDNSTISVITRETGSGTRSAFIELFEIQDKNKVDHTMDDANQTNNTSVMLNSVASDEAAIGYVSLGSLNQTVKTVAIDGVQPSVENILNKTYSVSRPFNIAYNKDKLSDVAKEFITFLQTTDAQKNVELDGYIKIDSTSAYKPNQSLKGKLVIGGSSSVSPLMEKLIEQFKKFNPNIEVELQTSDSTTGIQGAIESTFDIAMSSRDLKDSESALTPLKIATDGLAVIVNPNNNINNLTKEQVKNIYTGIITSWGDVTE